MTRARVLILIITILVVTGLATIAISYARGYRFSPESLEFKPNGLLVIKSRPDGASVFLNGELETATNASVHLTPSTYDVSVRREGFLTWEKRLVIEKEVVTESTVHLFKSAPSLSAVTFSGTIKPVPSVDGTKLAFVVPGKTLDSTTVQNKPGLWVIETVNLPIGFSQEPRPITDGDLEDATWEWSPDGREILLSTDTGTFLLDAGEFTPQSQRVNITAVTRNKLLEEWEAERVRRLNAKLRALPEELVDLLSRKTKSVIFSPDEDMILYTASSSATIPKDLIKQLPGSSTQKQQRDIIPAHSYVYDIKEDRNFFVTDKEVLSAESTTSLRWFATSRHLVLAEEGKVTIMDYDGTNRQVVYSGSYVAPHAFPTLSTDRLHILTTLGADDSLPNLYSLSLK